MGVRCKSAKAVRFRHMDLRVVGRGPSAPFLGARDLFETERELSLPVRVRVREDPDERTWAGHYDDHHVLNISKQAATSVMARELALHEFAHMLRYEEEHPSHFLDLREVVYLALTGRRVEQRVLQHCQVLANHVKDVYADDITLDVGPADKLLAFLESELAAAIVDNPSTGPRGGYRLTAGADRRLTVVNAAFAIALLERNDAVPPDHHIYKLAHAAAEDAPEVDFDLFRDRFKTLARDPDESECRRVLVDLVREYAEAHESTNGPAAD